LSKPILLPKKLNITRTYQGAPCKDDLKKGEELGEKLAREVKKIPSKK
jgi:hypothetical protein